MVEMVIQIWRTACPTAQKPRKLEGLSSQVLVQLHSGAVGLWPRMLQPQLCFVLCVVAEL